MRSAYRTVGSVKGDPISADPMRIGIDSVDRTVRTQDEKDWGVCIGRRWTFVSMGPDGRMGRPEWDTKRAPIERDGNKDGIDDWSDNIFSQTLTKPMEALP